VRDKREPCFAGLSSHGRCGRDAAFINADVRPERVEPMRAEMRGMFA